MTENITAICYLISAIFFILALKGLSHPESARNGNIMGIIGMIIAIITTLNNPNVDSMALIILGIIYTGIDQILFRGKLPFTLKHKHADHDSLKPANDKESYKIYADALEQMNNGEFFYAAQN